MLRKSLAIPAAAFLILGGTAGMAQVGGTAHARTAADNYSGTISVTDYQIPNALGGGAGGALQVNYDLISMMTDGAIGIDNKGNFYADLATEVPTTSNGGLKVVNGNETITYHLKPNQKWSNGSPITQADWIAQWVLGYSPENSANAGGPADLIKSVTFSGNDMVLSLNGVLGSALQQLLPIPQPWEFYQKKYGATVTGIDMTTFNRAKELDPKSDLIPAALDKSSGLAKLVTAYDSDNYISPSDIWSGPYKLQTWSADQRYVLVPNTYYTALPADPKHPRPAVIQQIVLSKDGPTYVQDLKAGSTFNTIDSATDFDPDNITDLKSTKYNVVVQPGLSYEILDFMVGPTFNGKPNPLADVRVRQALDFAINKDQYIAALFPGYNPKTLELASLIPGASPWSINSQLPQNDYNPAKARALLQAAGYATTLGTGGNHLNLDFVTTNKTSRIKGSQIFQRFFNQVGVGIKIRYALAGGQNGLFSSWNDGGIQDHHTFQISLHGYGTNPDPDEGSLSSIPSQITTAANPTGANVDNLNDPHLTNLFTQGRSTLDNAKRHAIYNEVQKYFWQKMYNISLFTNPIITVYKGTVGNAKPNITQGGPWWNAYQWFYDPTNSQKPLMS